MAGAARVLESLNLKRTFVAGLLVLLALGMTSCTDQTEENPRHIVPGVATLQPGDSIKLGLKGDADADAVLVVWSVNTPATITQDGVFTAPRKPGRYRVFANYTIPNGERHAEMWVTVKPVEKSGDDFSVDETPKAADPASLELVLEVSNPMAVSNGGKPPSFTLTQPRRVREISTYHWNDGKGTAAGGTITLTGPGVTQAFKTNRTGAGQGGVPNAVWIAVVDVTLQPGTYTVADSDPSTWAQNSVTKGLGMTWVRAEKR